MLSVIVPSRGRPASALELINTVADTRTVATTHLAFAVDADDPMLPLYREVVQTRSDVARLIVVAGGWMVAALNEAAARVVADLDVTVVGFLGDDHRPRTIGWDAVYLGELADMGAGVVFGDDLLQHDFVPTQCAMSADIVRRLGWMAHPNLRHMYVDTLWRDMAKPVGLLRYLPDVVVEHMHYLNGKAVEDDGYRRVNDPSVYSYDEQVFHELHASGMIRQVSQLIQTLAASAKAAAR
jgi:hypothetical protein